MDVKKIIYYISGIFLGILLSFVAHGIIEIIYINQHLDEGFIPKQGDTGHSCYLPPYLQIILPILGIIGGYLFASWGWRVVYEKNYPLKSEVKI